jgi:DNA-binding MarR family transcriptional regulator
MAEDELIDAIDSIVMAGVAMTSVALSRATGGQELTFPQWRVIIVLSPPESVPVAEVSRRIGVTLPATARQLRRLERRGFVTMEPDPLDGRVTRARLTDAGVRVRAAIIEERRTRISEALRDLDVGPSTARKVVRIAAALAASTTGERRGGSE